MTNTRKSTTATTELDTTAETAIEETKTVVGPALRHGQTPEEVTFAHHLRIAGRDYQPGQKAFVSPDYARQLRGNGYIARGRA
ncbi:hypothetical protein C6N75_12715 [Streptomyces solincola]|uniref:Uncharacterized protein n=1 Tax=Streptomyces solincola TaxID=2100817 RepID=A0A2S9PWR5_9ACTN|nr:hypothetical protein [Streptomyces solincola]PRH78862.1 hypothetical protein C6N75_12715 [Streptomyces solincola]